jgi:hypothetical protein
MQEIWELFNIEDPEDLSEDTIEQLLLALSHDARMGSHGHRTIRFHGSISGHPIVVLVDFGSLASFLATSIADCLPMLPRAPTTAGVKIANGQLLQCTTLILGCQFTLDNYTFQHDLCVLQLESYDLILGMDWLELYSPMQVH